MFNVALSIFPSILGAAVGPTILSTNRQWVPPVSYRFGIRRWSGGVLWYRGSSLRRDQLITGYYISAAMIHRKTKRIAAGRRDNNRFLCTVVRYGPAVGVVIFSLLSLWAVIAMYRTITGEKKNKKYASERKEISTERHAPSDSKLTGNKYASLQHKMQY